MYGWIMEIENGNGYSPAKARYGNEKYSGEDNEEVSEEENE